MLLQRFRLALVPQRVDRLANLVLAPKRPLKTRVCPADGKFGESSARLRGNVHEMVNLPRV
jgi:hypothetical protein